MKDDVRQYAEDVLSGKILAGKPVRLACERHLRDFEHQIEMAIRFDIDLAQHYILFFEQMLTVEVNNQVRPFSPEPFQRFIIGSVFGWLNGDGTRRFRNAYIEQGKGNGKSPLAAGIGIAGLVIDGQVSPEVYAAAVTREQAQILWKDAQTMVERSPELKAIIESRVGSLYYAGNNGIFRPVSSEHQGLDGKRVHMALIDEIHEHPTDLVVNKMRAGTKARRNALIFEITNSGSDLESLCRKHHEYSLSVLDRTIADPAWFAYVCALDKKTDEHPADDWMNDESCWPKVNPGLGTILPVQYLREQVREAKGMPSKRNIVARLNFCVWTQQHELWIPIEKWEACSERFHPDDRRGEACWLGLDLSDKLDLSVAVAVFKYPVSNPIQVTVADEDANVPTVVDQEGKRKTININFGIDLLPYFFIPEETMYEREREDKVPYSDWVKQGFVIATPGQIIDYDYIYNAVKEDLGKKFSIQQIGYDPRGATQLALQLGGAGFEMVEITQGYNNMSEPSQIFEALVIARRIRHNGNPVMHWCVQNAAVKHSKDNRMIIPYKSHQRKRIDGVTGAVIGLGRAMIDEGNSASIYDHPEPVWIEGA